jgi:predicted NUDIX family NTP pyrophosphohydrolase
MPKLSAGVLVFKKSSSGIQVFLVHPGGPFWKNKDAGAWSIPKGEYAEGTDPLEAAKRELLEETGAEACGELIPLGRLRQPSGKVITAWALERDSIPLLQSNTFSMEWPPKSGRMQAFPEVDRGDWFSLHEARKKITKGQMVFLDRLTSHFSR